LEVTEADVDGDRWERRYEACGTLKPAISPMMSAMFALSFFDATKKFVNNYFCPRSCVVNFLLTDSFSRKCSHV